MNIQLITCNYKDNENEICTIRFEVFVAEQRVPKDLEIDGLDDKAKHVVAYIDGIAVGTASNVLS